MADSSITIRPAAEADAEVLCSFDAVAQRDGERREFIRHSVASGVCHVAADGGGLIGYGVLTYGFYRQGFVEMLYVHPGRRRRGAGAVLLRHLESLCRSPKLFTSTNLSNLPMQSLLNSAGYALSGVIHNLDEGDPEVVYFKRLARPSPPVDRSGPTL
jgi:GNAT superfamily N-acetyltransferase